MRIIEELGAHRISLDLFSRGKLAIPDEGDIEHVQNMLIEGYHSGELVTTRLGDNGQDYEFTGWWRILGEFES